MDDLKSHLKAVRTGIASVLQSQGSAALRLDPDFLATAIDIINILGPASRSSLSVDGLQCPDQLEEKADATNGALLDSADRGTAPVPQALGHWEDAPGGLWEFPPEVVDFSSAQANAEVKVYFHCLWPGFANFIDLDWYGESPGTRFRKIRQIPGVRLLVMPADRSGRLAARVRSDEELFSTISALVKTLTEDYKTFWGSGLENIERPYVRFSGPPRYFLSFANLLSGVVMESFGPKKDVKGLSSTLRKSLLNRCREIVLQSENSALLRSILVPPTQYRVGWQQWSPPLIWSVYMYEFALEVKDKACATQYLEKLPRSSPIVEGGVLNVTIPATNNNSVSSVFRCYVDMICLSDYDEF